MDDHGPTEILATADELPLAPYRRELLLAYGAMLLATLLNLWVPQLLKQAIDQGIAAGQARTLLTTAGIILAIAVVRGLFAFAQRFYGEWLSFRVAYDLRNAFYDKLQHLPFVFHDQAQKGDLMSRPRETSPRRSASPASG